MGMGLGTRLRGYRVVEPLDLAALLRGDDNIIFTYIRDSVIIGLPNLVTNQEPGIWGPYISA